MNSWLPNIPLSLSSLFYALGYLAGCLIFFWMARRRGVATHGIAIIAASSLVGGLAGANAIQWLIADEVGKTIIGGLACGYLTVVVVKRYLGIIRPLGDLFALGMSAGEAIGRWGCFVGGCCYGRVAHVPWAVWQHGAWRHPTQIYLSLASFVTLLILWRLELRRNLPENALFYLQGILFCSSRFAIEFFRAGAPAAYGLTLAQWACCAGLIFFAVRLCVLMRSIPVLELAPEVSVT